MNRSRSCSLFLKRSLHATFVCITCYHCLFVLFYLFVASQSLCLFNVLSRLSLDFEVLSLVSIDFEDWWFSAGIPASEYIRFGNERANDGEIINDCET